MQRKSDTTVTQSLPPLFQIGSRFPELHSMALKALGGDQNIYRPDVPRWAVLYNSALRKLFADLWARSQNVIPIGLARELIRTISPLDNVTLIWNLNTYQFGDELSARINSEDYYSLIWAERKGNFDWWDKLREYDGINSHLVNFILKEEKLAHNPYQFPIAPRIPEPAGARAIRGCNKQNIPKRSK